MKEEEGPARYTDDFSVICRGNCDTWGNSVHRCTV
jgi:hypothetical protein